MRAPVSIFDWIDSQQPRLVERVAAWAAINSGSLYLDGLARQATELVEAFSTLGGEISEVGLPAYARVDARGKLVGTALGSVIEVVKRPAAARCVLLGIHYDTVYGVDHAFERVERVSAERLVGPGVTDAKGGIVVMLAALEALEREHAVEDIGWRVILNPDEEIGSPGSAALLEHAATTCDIGLVFEPALADGSLIGARKGSGNYALVIRGRSAHAGRAFFNGRNALHLAAHAIEELTRMIDRGRGVTVNVGAVDGGGPVNVVADTAVVRFNVRVERTEDRIDVEQRLNDMVMRLNEREGFTAQLHGRFGAPPKLLDDATEQLLGTIRDCGREMGLNIRWQSSGGVCDGNRLAAAGLPVVDTLGPRGGEIHSDQEYLEVESLAERAKLTALLLWKLAHGEADWPLAGAGARALPSLFE